MMQKRFLRNDEDLWYNTECRRGEIRSALGCIKGPSEVSVLTERLCFVAAGCRGAEHGERRSRIELELKTGNFQRRSNIRGRAAINLVAHSLVVFFRGLFPVPQLRRDERECATPIFSASISAKTPRHIPTRAIKSGMRRCLCADG